MTWWLKLGEMIPPCKKPTASQNCQGKRCAYTLLSKLYIYIYTLYNLQFIIYIIHTDMCGMYVYIHPRDSGGLAGLSLLF